MRCRTIETEITHGIYTAVLFVLGCMGANSFIYNVKYIRSGDDLITLIVGGFLTVLMWGVVFFEMRSFGSRLFFDEDGIGVRRFGKTKVYLRWESICEAGIGFIPTPFGNKKRLYLSDSYLSEEEKRDLLTLKYKTVHFSYVPDGWTDMIMEHCPVLKPDDCGMIGAWENKRKAGVRKNDQSRREGDEKEKN